MPLRVKEDEKILMRRKDNQRIGFSKKTEDAIHVAFKLLKNISDERASS